MQWRSERVVVSRHVCYGLEKEVTQSQGMPKITVLVPPPVLPSPARRNRRRNEPGPGPSKHSALPTQRSKRESKGETHYGIPSARSRVSGRCDVLFSPADRANVCVDQHRSALAVVMAETTAGSHLGDAGQRWGGQGGKGGESSAESNGEQQHTRRALDVGSAAPERCGETPRAYRHVPRFSQLSSFTEEARRTASLRREKQTG